MAVSALAEAMALGVAASAVLGIVVWLRSIARRDVSIVDGVWSLLVLVPAVVVAATLPQTGPRATAVLCFAGLWAVRLAGYIVWRHRGRPEDRRYQEIRQRNEPHFAWKSLYLVFGLQVLLAAIVAAPLAAAVAGTAPWKGLDAVGFFVAAVGLMLEAVADAQMSRFRSDPRSRGQVMDRGLWRFSRHPNYFGECCLWWGLWLVAVAADAWWSVVSPLLMTWLLVRVSGVPLLEADLRRQRPGYAEYVRRTPAFAPWRLRG